MKNPTPTQIANEIKGISGVNIFENTRGTQYVELRSLVCFILRDKLQMRWTYIAEFFEKNGKNMNHSTAMHLVKMYPQYRNKNNKLVKLEKKFMFTQKQPIDEIDKITYLEKKYVKLESEFLELNDRLKNPLVNLVLDVPTNRTQELKSRIKMIKNAWS
jgi:hypothetical protein|tara:strand:- start:15 stop:491 length:477 start_codon:yes stop_codon:yes gene_type:complete